MNKKEIIFLKPFFQEKIWGYSIDNPKIKKWIRKDFLPSNIKIIGEIWLISAHSNGESLVINGKYKNLYLSFLWKNHQKLFNYFPSKNYPFLTKILLPSNDLSVQVHPDDNYAKEKYNDSGKEECWYILDLKNEKEKEIIYGHTAKNKKELNELIDKKEWNKLLKKIKVEKNQFIYINAGTIHALLKNIIVFELQQNSDITFRLYDYDRKDKNNKLREIHINEAKESCSVPHQDSQWNGKTFNNDLCLIKNQFFNLEKIVVNQKFSKKNYSYLNANWIQISIINGKGKIDNTEIKSGDNFILPFGYNQFNFQGEFFAMLVWI
jgi:mannose-6-phosphate isomerase